MIIEADIPRAKKTMDKRLWDHRFRLGITAISMILLPTIFGSLFGMGAEFGIFVTFIVIPTFAILIPLLRYINIIQLKHHLLTLEPDGIQMQSRNLMGEGITQVKLLWSDIKGIKLSDDIMTIHLDARSSHKQKMYQFFDWYTHDIAKMHTEIEQRWLSEKVA